MSFYDPFLVDEQVAQQSLDLINALNYTEETNYERFGITLAPVAEVFQTKSMETNPYTQRPVSATRICVLTLMCPKPSSTAEPDIHSNQLGYWVLASTFARAFQQS